MAPAIPKSGEFLEGRLWFQRKGTLITLGVTNLALDELGSVESLELPEEGDDFDAGDVILTLDGTKGSVEVITPAAGLVVGTNQAMADEPERIAEDPMEEGWLVKIEIQDPSDLQRFVDEEYSSGFGGE